MIKYLIWGLSLGVALYCSYAFADGNYLTDFGDYSVTTGTLATINGGSHIQNYQLVNGKLEVVVVVESPFVYPEGGSPPGEAIKYIYAAKGGKVVLEEEIHGVWHPRHSVEMPSSIQWPDQPSE